MTTPALEHKTLTTADGAQLKLLDTGNGQIAGYASTFGNVDRGGDVVVKGAFAASLPTFLRDGFVPVGHDWNGLPVATITSAHEDDHGLYVEAEFHSTPEAQAARTVVKERLERGKSVGLSIGYAVAPGGAKQLSSGVRELSKLDLFEYSIVTVPMNAAALATSAKSLDAETKGAIPYKKTGTTNAAWDGPEMESRLPSKEAALRACMVWVDPDGNPDAKASYKGPHHLVSTDGTVGDASTRACSAIIAALNGSRGSGFDVPEKDRDGIYSHAKRHLLDSSRPEGSIPALKSIEQIFSDVLVELARRNVCVEVASLT